MPLPFIPGSSEKAHAVASAFPDISFGAATLPFSPMSISSGGASQPDRKAARPTSAEDRLRLILQNIVDYAIFTIDPDGFVTDWTEGAQRVKGWRPEEIIGRHLSMFYTPEQIAAGAVDRELKEAAATG